MSVRYFLKQSEDPTISPMLSLRAMASVHEDFKKKMPNSIKKWAFNYFQLILKLRKKTLLAIYFEPTLRFLALGPISFLLVLRLALGLLLLSCVAFLNLGPIGLSLETIGLAPGILLFWCLAFLALGPISFVLKAKLKLIAVERITDNTIKFFISVFV
jgi:hypothetical protein